MIPGGTQQWELAKVFPDSSFQVDLRKEANSWSLISRNVFAIHIHLDVLDCFWFFKIYSILCVVPDTVPSKCAVHCWMMNSCSNELCLKRGTPQPSETLLIFELNRKRCGVRKHKENLSQWQPFLVSHHLAKRITRIPMQYAGIDGHKIETTKKKAP